jgi:pyruvate ferredoxin oxidoreductase alpha subunit
MGARDAGWVQIFSEDAQQVYDNVLQAFRIAEDPEVQVPVMVTLDGFILSHTMETLELLPDEVARKWAGPYTPQRMLLDVDNPMTIGPLDLQDYYFEHKRSQVLALEKAKEAVLRVGQAYGEMTGRSYGYFNEYLMEDADVVIVVLGSTAGTAKDAADMARDKGIAAGVLSVRCFRPACGVEIATALGRAKAVGVMDRSISFGMEGGPVFHEIRSYMGGGGDKMSSYVYGLGGRDTTREDVLGVFERLAEGAAGTWIPTFGNFVGLRE